MHDSNRGDGTTALTGQKADTAQSEQQPANGNKQRGEPDQAVTSLLKQPPRNSETAVANYESKTEQPDPYQLRDLIAQEVMADAAVWMAVAAFLTFAITSMGTLLIWRQVKLTREAVEDTGKATLAMERQNEIARESMEKQLRAYIVTTYVEIFFDKSKPGHIQIAAHFQNVGETPATNVTASIFGRVLHGTQFRCDRTRGNTEGGKSNLVMAKGSKPSIVSHSLELYQGLTGDDAINGDYSVFAFGFIQYKDVFDRDRETEFCFVTNPKSRQTTTAVIAAQDGNHCG